MSDDAREKRAVPKQGICVEVEAGKPEQRLTRSPRTGQDSGAGSGEQRALEHRYPHRQPLSLSQPHAVVQGVQQRRG